MVTVMGAISSLSFEGSRLRSIGVRASSAEIGCSRQDQDAWALRSHQRAIAAQDAGLYADSDITGRVPMARFATPDDIAQAIAFLGDPAQSSFVNGHALSVDGGWASDGSWESLRLRHR